VSRMRSIGRNMTGGRSEVYVKRSGAKLAHPPSPLFSLFPLFRANPGSRWACACMHGRTCEEGLPRLLPSCRLAALQGGLVLQAACKVRRLLRVR
jgi:hypothetical protein